MTDWKELEKQYYMPVFKRLPVVFVRGEGARVWDENGKSYLDMVAGLAVNVLGHCHPAVVEAITKQARTLIHTTNLYYTIPQLELAKLIVEHSCGRKVFFANSGAEANEGAIKLARKHGKLHRNGAYEVISAVGSFHGRTLVTLAATGQEKFHKTFVPMPKGFVNVAYNDLDALKAATTEKTAAVLLEPIQGESGVYPADPEYLRGVRAWCDQNNLLFMLDEIQTGMGRTGQFLAHQQYGVEPDVFTLAKGLAGGVPIGVVVAPERGSCFELGDHGSTFGGNPLACAAAVATLNTLFGEGIIENAAQVGRYMLAELRALRANQPAITDVRGMGLMVAFDIKEERGPELTERALAKGVILNATGPTTVRLIPPLIITKSDVDEAVAAIADILNTW